MDPHWYKVYTALNQLEGNVYAFINFEKEIRFLQLFLDLAHRWPVAEHQLPDLGSLVIKVKTQIREIGNRILIKQKQTKNPFSKLLLLVRNNWVDDLSTSIAAIQSLKPEMRQVCFDPLVLLNSFHTSQLCFSVTSDFSNWRNFVQSVRFLVKFVGLEKEIGNCFVNRLDIIIQFLDGTKMNDGREVFMHRVEGIVIPAASVFLKSWLVQMDQAMVKEMANTVSDLRRQIDLSCSVEFVDMILELVITKRVTVYVFVSFFIVPRWDDANATIRGPCFRELESLITYITNTPRISERFIGDLKILVMEAAALQDASYFRQRCTILINFLAKLRLLQTEIYLAEQLKLETGNKLVIGFNLQKTLRDWEHLHEFTPRLTTMDDLEQVMSIMETVESDIKWVNQSSLHRGTVAKKVEVMFSKLLIRTLLFKTELYLKMFKKSDTFTGKGIKSLQEGLKFMTMFIVDYHDDEVGDINHVEKLLHHIEAFLRGVILFCHSFPNGEIPEEMFQKTSLQVHALQRELQVIMTDLKSIYRSVPWLDFPKAYPQDLVDNLLRNLRELPDFKSQLDVQEKHEMEDILGHMEFLKSLIMGIQQQEKDVEEFKVLVARVVNLAYNVECFVHTVVMGRSSKLKILVWRYHLLQDITDLKEDFEEIYDIQNHAQRVHSISDTPGQDILGYYTQGRTQDPGSAIDYTPRSEEVVGNGEDESIIIDRLIRGSSHQDIISIIGMPGIGKTTLATKAYNNIRTQYYFHIRAWCRVSQNYKKTELLHDILSQIKGHTENRIGMSDEDLELKLYQCLKQRRYLIFMDDIWSTEAWEDLKRSLPDDLNGSRILITTRLLDVALKIKPDSDPHLMSLLSDDESWDLLQRKVFHEAECPAELVESGKLIASNCKGLPLSVVAIGGVLERREKSRDFWNRIAENLSSHVLNDPQAQCKDILSLSYNHLPNNLKVCFLYFSAFPGDKDIPVWKLTCLWIAEGFISEIGTKSLEEVAEDYLMDLIDRSLLTVAESRSKGGVKSCRMHDLLRDLCKTKSVEEKFLNWVIENPDDSMGYGPDYGDHPMLNESSKTYKYYNDHRLSIYSKRRPFVMSQSSGPYVRSLFFFAMSDSYPRCPYNITFISDNFKLLKVLDLESLNSGYFFPTGIVSLILLRYLALSGDIDSVPSTLAELCNMETLLVKGLKGRVVLPNTIWSMSRLRHLHITDLAMLNMENVKVSQLHNLVTLSFVLLPQGKDSDILLRGLPNLRKLSCGFAEPQNTNEFPRLDLLTKLESLKIRYYGKALDTCEFNFPLNLKKLSLLNFGLPWNNISVVGKLPSLEVLKLSARAFEGKEWEMTEGEFLRLKYLKMDALNIVQWTASEDHLPNLEHLMLQSCKDLEGVPSSFANIPTLQVIQAKWCGRMVEESLKIIQDEEIEGLKIVINTKM